MVHRVSTKTQNLVCNWQVRRRVLRPGVESSVETKWSCFAHAHRTPVPLYAVLWGRQWLEDSSRWPVDDVLRNKKTSSSGLAHVSLARSPFWIQGISKCRRWGNWWYGSFSQSVAFKHVKSFVIYNLHDTFLPETDHERLWANNVGRSSTVDQWNIFFDFGKAGKPFNVVLWMINSEI